MDLAGGMNTGEAMSSAYAFGKVILLGEHAVVYGQPALASALGRGCAVSVYAAKDIATLTLGGDCFRVNDAKAALARALGAALEEAGLVGEPLDARVSFEIPVGAGLGSSAALAVALARAFFAHAAGRGGASPDPARIAAAADRIERIFHGNPSGLDAHLARTGALGLFRKGEGLTPIAAPASVKLVIADSGGVRSTQAMVDRVRAQKERVGRAIDRLIEAIGALAEDGARALAAGELGHLGELMNVNQSLLAALGVSTPEIEHLTEIAREAGALGAKLTGAGGGGCVIALAPGKEEIVAAALARHAKSVVVSELGARA